MTTQYASIETIILIKYYYIYIHNIYSHLHRHIYNIWCIYIFTQRTTSLTTSALV